MTIDEWKYLVGPYGMYEWFKNHKRTKTRFSIIGRDKPLPEQYQTVINDLVLDLSGSAQVLWPVVEEFGDEFECEAGKLIITIKRKDEL